MKLGVLLVVLCVAGVAYAGSKSGITYTKCESMNDCPDPQYPFCLLYWDKQFESAGLLSFPFFSQRKGVCVQCQTECDCPVNMFCAKDFTVPNLLDDLEDFDLFEPFSFSNDGEQPAKGDTIRATETSERAAKQRLEMAKFRIAARSLESLSIPSICQSYGEPVGRMCSPTDELANFHEEFMILHDGTYQYANPRGVVANASELNFCGLVSEFIPSSVPAVPLIPTGNLVKRERNRDFFLSDTVRTPGMCFKSVFDRGQRLLQGQCKSEIVTTDYPEFAQQGITIRTKEPQWQGTCTRGVCNVCSEGDRRCTTFGVPQLCVSGRWIEYHINDFGLGTLSRNVIGQVQLATSFFLTLLLLLVGWATLKLERLYIRKPVA